MSIHGILPISKPRGITSHAVVSTLRKILKMKKIGHAGTLDPDARGLLLICLGKATKISSLMMEGDKTYRVRFRLGVETNTYDSTGEVVAEKEARFSKEDLEVALANFSGEITQVAPPFSAVKVRGKKLYQYARKGEDVERPSRSVRIHRLDLLEFEGTDGELEVSCSKGTYIRTLVHDLGQILGCGAITTDILRTRSGQFDLESSVALEELLEVEDPPARVKEVLLSISKALAWIPQLELDARSRERVVHGNPLGERELVYCKWGRAMEGPEKTILLLDENREALALASYDGHAHVKVSRVF